ncbi:DUF4254 domain-containing protein [Nocardia sp. GCM10030253]|uniref:DUF4254 domain-containing protein n=1 Tax=Nocardia sp. GCM10030253 TaxID=3273404 RepID=UPI00364446E5
MTHSAPLPGKNLLLAACRGDANNDHPLLRSARELAELHEQRVGASRDRVDEIDHERTRLVREIDYWVTGQLPPSLGAARVHTETIGAVVDRLGQFTAGAFAALASGSNSELGDAWERLAELAIGYEDLKDEVSVGHRRLPGAP